MNSSTFQMTRILGQKKQKLFFIIMPTFCPTIKVDKHQIGLSYFFLITGLRDQVSGRLFLQIFSNVAPNLAVDSKGIP